MSVCASANLFSSRKVSLPSRRPLANNERWAALNKNIFQDILNAILFQTTFSSAAAAAAAGKRHLLNRTEINPHSASPPCCTESEALLLSAGAEGKDDISFENLKDGLDSLDHGVLRAGYDTEGGGRHAPPEDATGAVSECQRCTTGRALPVEKNNDEPASVDDTTGEERAETTPVVSDERDSLETDLERSKVSEIVCPFRRQESSRHDMSTSFPVSERRGMSESSPFGVYCETLIGNVPMMIIGLRPYIRPQGTGGLVKATTRQMSPLSSHVPIKCPTEISVNTSPQGGAPVCSPRKRDFDRCVKILSKSDDFRSRASQLHSASATKDAAQQQLQKSYHHQLHRQQHLQQHDHHHHHHHHHHHSEQPWDSTTKILTSAEVRSIEAERAEKGDSGVASSSKSSSDHSILTILGLLSTDDEDQKRSSSEVTTAAGVTKTVENKRLLGIGVTVTGGSRWMAVDKEIVYDMIDQVLNGERGDYLYNSTPYGVSTLTDHSKPSGQQEGVKTSRAYSCSLKRDRTPSQFVPSAPRGDKNYQEQCSRGSNGNSKGKRVTDVTNSGKTGDLGQAGHSRSTPDTTLTQQHPPVKCQKAAAKEGRTGGYRKCPSPSRDSPSSTDHLEGVSVLRSLLSDDQEERTTSVAEIPPTTPCSTDAGKSTPDTGLPPSGGGGKTSLDYSKMAFGQWRPIKRSRHQVADSKKRRTNGPHPHPSPVDDDVTRGLRSHNHHPPSGASRAPDQQQQQQQQQQQPPSCSSSLSMKWKSSMLLRMRTEEGIENEAVAACRRTSSGGATFY